MIILYADGCTYWIDASAIYVPPFWREEATPFIRRVLVES